MLGFGFITAVYVCGRGGGVKYHYSICDSIFKLKHITQIISQLNT